MKKIIIFLINLIIVSLVLSGLALAQYDTIETPQNIEEATQLGENIVRTGIRDLPQITVRLFKERVLPVWQKMYDWLDRNILVRAKILLGQEVEKRKEIIGKEWEEEKQEMKEDIPKVGQSLWERFKKLWE